MNKKIYFQELVDLLVDITKIDDRAKIEEILKDLFLVIQAGLEEDGIVKVKKLGTFKTTEVDARRSVHVNTGEIIEIPAYTKIVFTPDKDLAQAVNMAFAGFETVELDDTISPEQVLELNEIEAEIEEDSTAKVKETIEPESVVENITIQETTILPPPIIPAAKPQEDEVLEQIELSKDEEPNVEQSDPTPNSSPQPIQIDAPTFKVEQEEQPIPVEEYEDKKKLVFTKGFFTGFITGSFFILIVIFMVSYSIGFPLVINGNNEDVLVDSDAISLPESDDVMNMDTALIPEELPKREVSTPAEEFTASHKTAVVTDTISQTRYLTTMARKYYGDYNFWVYIYEENKSKIDNPNKIKPGTVMVIPSAEKYGIDKNNPKSLSQAKEKGYSIYKKYE